MGEELTNETAVGEELTNEIADELGSEVGSEGAGVGMARVRSGACSEPCRRIPLTGVGGAEVPWLVTVRFSRFATAMSTPLPPQRRSESAPPTS
jgi:hypothetical protein